MDKDQITIETWKQTIAVQTHFNDLELRIRAFGLTAIAAILGLAGLDKANANILVLVAAIVIWPAFFLMDRFWYHPLLKAAVKHGETIEQIALEEKFYMKDKDAQGAVIDVCVLGLTTRISKASHIKLGPKTMDSGWKMVAYYFIVWVALWLIFLLTFLIGKAS